MNIPSEGDKKKAEKRAAEFIKVRLDGISLFGNRGYFQQEISRLICEAVAETRTETWDRAIERVKAAQRTWDGRVVANSELEFDSEAVVALLLTAKATDGGE